MNESDFGLVAGPWTLRVANSGIGVAVAVIGATGAMALMDDGTIGGALCVPLIALSVAVGVLLLVRALRLGVVCGADALVVRGLLWSRTISRDAVFEVSRDPLGDPLAPVIRWRDHRGRRRWTPLTAFWVSSSTLSWVTRQAAEGLRRVSSDAR